MDDPTASSSNTRGGQPKQMIRPSCPCCVFMSQDLFLPPRQLTTTSVSTEEKDEPLPNEVVSPLDALKCIEDHAQKLQLEQQQQQQRDNDRKSAADAADAAEDVDAEPKKKLLPMLLVDTHNHAHLRQERHTPCYNIIPTTSPDGEEEAKSSRRNEDFEISVVSLTMSVETADWDDAVKYSASDCGSSAVSSGVIRVEGTNNGGGGDDTSTIVPHNTTTTTRQRPDSTLMGFGIHPWYLHAGVVEPDGPWKEQLEDLLRQHPSAIVGEIGLCKMAKCARNHPDGKARGFEIQRSVLKTQLELAIQYRRPVSIHCVQQHGVFLELLSEMMAAANVKQNNGTTDDPMLRVPPAMAMHSFTGTAHHVKALLQWEATLSGEGPNDRKKKQKKKQNQHTSTTTTSSTDGQSNVDNEKEDTVIIPQHTRAPLFYFGFSHLVNYDMCTSDKARRSGREAVRAVPLDRLLAESDVHHPLDVPAGTAGAIAYMAWALERPIPEVAEITARNGLAFLQSHLL